MPNSVEAAVAGSLPAVSESCSRTAALQIRDRALTTHGSPSGFSNCTRRVSPGLRGSRLRSGRSSTRQPATMYRSQLGVVPPRREAPTPAARGTGGRRVEQHSSWSQCLQEAHQRVRRRWKPAQLGVGCLEPCERLLLHREVGFDVAMGGVALRGLSHSAITLKGTPYCSRCIAVVCWRSACGETRFLVRLGSRVAARQRGQVAGRRCSASSPGHSDWAARPLRREGVG